MIAHSDISSRQLRALIKSQHIQFAGNRKLKIYGRLDCTSGKGLKIENRVFFSSQHEALKMGYRPCGKCMRRQYKAWKNKL